MISKSNVQQISESLSKSNHLKINLICMSICFRPTFKQELSNQQGLASPEPTESML